MRVLASLLLLFALVAPASADDAAEARAHYQKATSHFAVGEFAQAADEYQEAYKLKADSALLFNAAQARRLASENEKALILYRNYLALYPKAKNATEVRDQIAKLQEAIAAAEKAKTAPPMNTQEPAPQPAPAPPPVAEPAPQPQVATQAAAPAERTPVYKKWWLWTAVGVVVVAAVVIPVAVVEGSSKWANVADQGPGAALTVRW